MLNCPAYKVDKFSPKFLSKIRHWLTKLYGGNINKKRHDKLTHRNFGQNDWGWSFVKGCRQDPVNGFPDEAEVADCLRGLENLFQVDRRRVDEAHRLGFADQKRLWMKMRKLQYQMAAQLYWMSINWHPPPEDPKGLPKHTKISIQNNRHTTSSPFLKICNLVTVTLSFV